MTCDQNLLARAQKLEASALAEFYDTFSPGLYRYAIRLLGCADLAEECVSEVFSRLLHALHAGNGPRDYLQAYLYRTAHNWITDHWRRQPPPPLTIEEDGHPDGRSDPCQAVEEQLEKVQIRAALAGLTPDQRQVIMQVPRRLGQRTNRYRDGQAGGSRQVAAASCARCLATYVAPRGGNP